MTYQNYKGDFYLIEKFYSDESMRTQLPVPQHVKISYFTLSGYGKYVVERNGDDFVSCSLSEDGMGLNVHLALSDQCIGVGELLKIVTEIIEDDRFPNGIRNIPTPGKTGVILYTGVSDNTAEIVSTIVTPISLYGSSAYDLAVKHGFDGSEEDWLKSLKGDPGQSISVPVYDLLKSRARRKAYEHSHSSGGKNDILYDYTPCLRFLGAKPSDDWTVQIYMYRNRKNVTYKKILEASLAAFEAPSNMSGNGYQTIVMPWSLMRIFWELFDPMANGGSVLFHDNQYNEGMVSYEWINKCYSGQDLQKDGSNNRTCSRRTTGAFFSGTFGIRIINDKSGVYGNLQKFRISLYTDNCDYPIPDGGNKLYFGIKIDMGITGQTLR